MASTEQQSLQELETRVRALMLSYRQLRAENAALLRQVEALGASVEQEKADVRKLRSELSALRAAQVITLEEDDVKVARARISRMIREIDKCIALLA